MRRIRKHKSDEGTGEGEIRFNTRERMKERKGNRCEKVSTVDNNQRRETEEEVAGVFFLSDITLVQMHEPRTEIKRDKDRQRRRQRDGGIHWRGKEEKGMVRLTLRMMERSCFWARIWAISYRGRKKRREK